MCNTCRRNSLKPEYESILHEAYSNELIAEEEWSDYYTKVKNYTSPFFNWLAGSSTPASGLTSEQQLVKDAMAKGQYNENSLTDLVFYKRHPELGGKPLSSSMSGFSSLSKEWTGIRDSIVRPLLKVPVTLPGAGTGSGTGNLQKIINLMTRKGYVIYTKPWQLNIVGVRAANAQPNSFDDTMNVFYKDNAGNWQHRQWAMTTEPGFFYLNNPMNVSGTAIVAPGQYINSHKIGLHRGEYTALVQQGPVTVFRDNNKDNVFDLNSGSKVSGVFGINIHKAGSSSTKVDKWSAGCQVFARSADFAEFIQLCQQHKSLYGNIFTYTLVEEKELLNY
jgi:hypothetical protein